jgi:hypothetical protein
VIGVPQFMQQTLQYHKYPDSHSPLKHICFLSIVLSPLSPCRCHMKRDLARSYKYTWAEGLPDPLLSIFLRFFQGQTHWPGVCELIYWSDGIAAPAPKTFQGPAQRPCLAVLTLCGRYLVRCGPLRSMRSTVPSSPCYGYLRSMRPSF